MSEPMEKDLGELQVQVPEAADNAAVVADPINDVTNAPESIQATPSESAPPTEQEPAVNSAPVEPPPAVQSAPVPAESAPVQPTAPKPLSNEAVTGHTASLWKYFPVPENEPEPVPEYINNTVHFPGSTAISARVRGKKHKHEGTNCDDWFEVAHLDDITFVAVSDGAGSRKFSRIGARESCRASVGYLVRAFEKLFTDRPQLRSDLCLELSEAKCLEACGVLAGVVQQAVVQAYMAVESAFYARATNPEYARVLKRDLQLKDLSGTLLLAVIVPVREGTKEHLVITCQIGDGMIALVNTEGPFSSSVKLMGIPDSGDFSGETDFLTSSKMKDIKTLQLRTKLSRSVVDTVLVMTDGVADDYFPNETQMRRLYFDLVVNGILERPDKSLSTLTQNQLKLFKRIPDPLAYPWVNDQSVRVPLQYTNRICEATGLTLEDLWNDPTALDLARLELMEDQKITDPSERLKVWLDNYVERGSFDDRTLVVVTM